MRQAGLKSRRLWVKFYTLECLQGSIRLQLAPDERGVWYDLIILAGTTRTPGLLQAGHGQPFTRAYIAKTLNISLPLLERTLQKCLDEGRLQETPEGLAITHWRKYQEGHQLGFPAIKSICAGGKLPPVSDNPQQEPE